MILKCPKNWQKMQKMSKNDPKWPKIAQKCQNYPKLKGYLSKYIFHTVSSSSRPTTLLFTTTVKLWNSLVRFQNDILFLAILFYEITVWNWFEYECIFYENINNSLKITESFRQRLLFFSCSLKLRCEINPLKSVSVEF